MNQSLFSSLNLKSQLLDNLKSLDYLEMTPVQSLSLPPILEGKDVIVQSKTGSGKTAAFGLGLLQKLDVGKFVIQSMVLCPTRELAEQVANEIRTLARTTNNIKVLSLCGGVPIGGQANSLEHGAHIVVGTPGRINDHLTRGTLDLSLVNTLVLDEADRMLSMGFADALRTIVKKVPNKRQTLLFSATYPETIDALSKKIMIEPVTAQLKSTHDNVSIQQHFYKVTDDTVRLMAVRLLLLFFKPESAIVFCNTIVDATLVTKELSKNGFSALPLHGELDQEQRDQTLIQFSNKSVKVIVATDVAARGLDIDSVDAVINYHTARDSEVHIHRIGRTGRADSKGVACSLYSEKEAYKVSLLETTVNPIFDSEPLPDMALLKHHPRQPAMTTLKINLGKKQKIRAGDILGALTSENGISGDNVGKINVSENWAYIAVKRTVEKIALQKINTGKIKGRNVRARKIGI